MYSYRLLLCGFNACSHADLVEIAERLVSRGFDLDPVVQKDSNFESMYVCGQASDKRNLGVHLSSYIRQRDRQYLAG